MLSDTPLLIECVDRRVSKRLRHKSCVQTFTGYSVKRVLDSFCVAQDVEAIFGHNIRKSFLISCSK